jgi:predicted transcriptional regulator
MPKNIETQTTNFVELTGDIVSAYVSNHPVRTADLPDLIRQVHSVLDAPATGVATAAPEAEIEKPSAAQVHKSVTPEGIVSFIDGKTYRTLKRHLGMPGFDPHSYRQRFGLSADDPMVAPEYAARRSELAKSIGLGRVVDRGDSAEPKATKRTKAA